MMRLRIFAGKSLSDVPVEREDMILLHQSPTLVVQGSPDVSSFTTADRQQAFLAGDIVGVRSRSGDLEAVSLAQSSFLGLCINEGIPRCQDSLEGRYVLVALDSNGSCKICADRFGQLELYYQERDGRTVFATDMSLLPASSGPVEYDQLGLAHALCVYGYRPPKHHTLFRGIRRLGVDQWVQIEGGKVQFKEKRFTPIPIGPYGQRELNEYADILLDSVRARGSRYGNVVYLSSGWDSTSLLACLVKVFGARRVRTVIGRMQYAERSGVINQFEVDRAKAVADYFGVRLDIVEFDWRYEIPVVLDRLRPLLRSHQIVSGTVFAHGTLADFVGQTTDGNEIVFAGEISDGAHNLGFSQFVTIFHPSLEFREYSDKMASYLYGPTFFRLFRSGQFANDPIYHLLRGRCGNAIFDEPAEDDLDRRKQLLASFFLRANRIPLWSLRNCKMLTDVGRERYSVEMEEAYVSRAAEEVTAETLYSWLLHLYNSFHWQGSTVRTMALTAEAESLRLALPFWDSRLQEFLSAMPENWGRGLDLNPTKYPLKWALKHRIDYPMHLQTGPHSYLYDVDPNFSHAAEILYGSALGPYFKSLLRKRDYRDVLSPEIFDLGYIDVLVDRYLEGAETRGAEMNDLITICFFCMVDWYGAE
ncbi:MAG: hypothetical protein HY663_02325 [Chloroflexi bacterium]|nr:hypothetical protein [Chloroflexota bacterium]